MLKRRVRILIAPLLTVIIIFLGVYFFVHFHNKTIDPQADMKREQEALVEQVSKLVLLPENENPRVATVSDPESLKKNQPAFVLAEEGDKVLIYTVAKRAIIFRPSKNKIVDIVRINIGTP